MRVLRGLQAVAAKVQFDDHTVVHQAVDGRRGGHGILEDLLPMRERQVAGQQDTAAFVAFRHSVKRTSISSRLCCTYPKSSMIKA